MSHGTWLAACLMLFSGRFDVGIIGSTKMWFTRGWELYGSHPLLDPLLSGGRMTIRNDEGLYHRAEKAEMLTRYPSALKDLRVCLAPYRADRNCCRCEKCVRTMLCFVACGHPIPPAFPHGLRLQDIKLYRGRRAGLQWIPGILASAERNGNSDLPEIRELRRQFRIKRLKVGAKVWSKALMKGRTPEKWYIFDTT